MRSLSVNRKITPFINALHLTFFSGMPLKVFLEELAVTSYKDRLDLHNYMRGAGINCSPPLAYDQALVTAYRQHGIKLPVCHAGVGKLAYDARYDHYRPIQESING